MHEKIDFGYDSAKLRPQGAFGRAARMARSAWSRRRAEGRAPGLVTYTIQYYHTVADETHVLHIFLILNYF